MSNTAAYILAAIIRTVLATGVCALHVLASYGAKELMLHYGIEDGVAYFAAVFVAGALYGRNLIAAEKWALKQLNSEG